ncbi:MULTISPECIES: formate C-acetyltransferase [Limnospira]|jgi:formate C-acetyltransferase|uniref:Formate acetyltransferase n=1 Tax=Limnospira platensis NIES-46 TaxID=1236695 RepID=A0A5M3TCL1_LIMPL|nr:formate C-acetyltransferase [Arthrospira platensis]MDF2211699.1 formate C-acetyltransferase [Arthrospira platensis NCB002]MDT9183475.1 formate C-acetyltransferase [Limnospira sp. PMC 289.06]MDT9294467.1 formate C-acetyltransferase [Arthrospira platensis PCC 7345]BAI88251.1 formate acetyltransferase [Arthrospira platensis NIES-39]BDT10672.1 formate acetyltransferase [Arthrospira platensis NIES-39]
MVSTVEKPTKLTSPTDNSSGNITPEWQGFKQGKWTKEVNVRDFIQKNYSLYEGDSGFLANATERTNNLWDQVKELMAEERKKGILDAETKIPSGINAYGAGYIDRSLEQIVGLQTDKPLKRAIMPYGGIRVVKKSLEAYGYELDPETEKIFTQYRKTHNDGVFDAYTPEILLARHSGLVTGLPDAYGRGRIIGDYRRVALYGVDRLILDKKEQQASLELDAMDSETIARREEICEEIRSLQELKEMAASYGLNIAKPAATAQEAVQWTYFGYLAAVKEQNGAAMSLGRVSNFLDIYFERDFQNGTLTESGAQEIIDHFVMKLRMVRFLRAPEYNQLFSGDPTWVTECIGGMGEDGRPLVTKNSFRFLHTLYTLGAAPEPNLTILWSERLPENFKRYCAKVSIETCSTQYENDDLMRAEYGDDYGIACCVSAMKIGKQMQFFGARANLAKALLYAINGGKDETTGEQIGPSWLPVKGDYLEYEDVAEKFDRCLEWLSRLYVNTLNIIHFMHDKYAYERIELALHDRDVYRTMACGMAGLSVVADAFSAIKYSRVKVIRNDQGLVVDYEIEGDYPKFGNNDDRVDDIAANLVKQFMNKIRQHKTYRNSVPTQSILTITSNVVYGKKTGNTPDGRKAGEPFAPGANPMHARDTQGAIAALASVAKLPYEHSQDGISYTFSIVPQALGKQEGDRISNLVGILDGYFADDGHHINVNVLNRETLVEAMEHPEKYPQLTIRVSGYAVNFIKLTREQQLDVINRTFHSRI